MVKRNKIIVPERGLQADYTDSSNKAEVIRIEVKLKQISKVLYMYQ